MLQVETNPLPVLFPTPRDLIQNLVQMQNIPFFTAGIYMKEFCKAHSNIGDYQKNHLDRFSLKFNKEIDQSVLHVGKLRPGKVKWLVTQPGSGKHLWLQAWFVFSLKTAAFGFGRSCKTLMLSELHMRLRITHRPGIFLWNNMERLCGWSGNTVFEEEILLARSAP